MGTHALHWVRRYDLPHVRTYHTFWARYVHCAGVLGPLFARWVHWRTHSFCNQCERIIAPSQALRDYLCAAGVTVPVEVIPTGTDFDALRAPRPRSIVAAEIGIPPGRRILGFAGRMAPEKNLVFLLDVLRRLTERGTDAHLVMVGDGPGRLEVRRRARALGLGGRLSFTGVCSAGADLRLLRPE
jgi:1,2-diacylglycerol 3-alpha-glucosyltransferase